MEYVAGFLYARHQEELLLVQKQKPDWQKGLLTELA